MDVITFPENLQTTSEISILLYDVISLQDATPFDKSKKKTSIFLSELELLLDFLVTVKAVPHECAIRTGQP